MITILRFRYLFSVLFFLSLFNGSKTLGQNTESTAFIGDPESGFSQLHADALSTSDLEQYRLRNSRRSLQFESGVFFELLSAVELTESGSLVDPGNYPTKDDLNPNVRIVFKLGAQGNLAVRSEIDPNSKLAAIEVIPGGSSQTKISAFDLEQMSEEKRAFVLSNPDMFLIE